MDGNAINNAINSRCDGNRVDGPCVDPKHTSRSLH